MSVFALSLTVVSLSGQREEEGCLVMSVLALSLTVVSLQAKERKKAVLWCLSLL